MSQPTGTAFAEPPIGPDGLIDVISIATRTTGEPAVRRAPLDLAALDAATPAAPVGPLGLPTSPSAPRQPQVSDHQLLINEVATQGSAEPGMPEGAVTVPLHNKAGETVAEFVVLHPDDWPSSANAEVTNPMTWTSWATKVLATDEQKDLWRAIDPTNWQVGRFIDSWNSASGNASGKGQPSNASSMTTVQPWRAT